MIDISCNWPPNIATFVQYYYQSKMVLICLTINVFRTKLIDNCAICINH